MTAEPVAFGAADVTNCDREQIHVPGSVQPHGCLLAMSPGDLRILQVGGDTVTLLGAEPQDLLGRRFAERIGPEAAAALHASTDGAPQARRLVSLDQGVTSPACDTDALVHKSGEVLILELEPAEGAGRQNPLGLIQGLVIGLQQAGTVQDFCRALVESVRDVSGFDRVMLYRFLQDGSGSVEAEVHAEGMEPYLGLRYPASDIPAQARQLYLHNTLRLIPDATYTPSPLLAGPDWPADRSLDLSHSVLRSVSPIHLEYLANMGVAASMSLSIVIEGRLWGLIACHHRTPRFLPQRVRFALDLFGQMASFQLETKLTAEDLSVRLRSKAIHETVVKEMTGDIEIAAGFHRLRKDLLDYVPATGLALLIDGAFAKIGQTPPEAEVRKLAEWLNTATVGGVFCTDRLAAHYPPANAFFRVASGVLALSVSRIPRDYLIWFRPEVLQVVRWAGDPNKPVIPGEGGARLSPRSSFADWREQVRRQSEPWSPADIKTVETLRVSLLEVVLEHVDQLARERQRARVQQDALLAQLDTRIAQWEQTARQLQDESDRRTVLETELSEVLRRTVVEQESERQRIARELHDSLGQYLTAMHLDLDGIARDGSVTTSIKARVDRLKSMTADAGHEVNHLAWEIRPTALDDLGLQTALQQFLEEWSERSALQFDLHLTLNNRRLKPAVETALYRVLQEAIRNVVKHAQASRVGVILEATETEACLIVEDDGRGFQLNETGVSAGPSSRLGLLGVRERLALVGGSLEIETSPGQGTTLLIHVPL